MLDPWTEEMPPDRPPPETLSGVLSPVALLALALGCFLVDQTFLLVGWTADRMLAGLFAASILGVLLPVWATSRILGLPGRSAVGLRGVGGRELGWTVWTVGSALAPVYAAGALVARFLPPRRELFEFYETLLPETPVDVLAGGLGVVVVGPLAEEVIFRSLVLGALLRLAPGWAAIGTSAILFAASHGSPWMLAPIALLGAVLGLLAWRTGNLTTAWLGHGLFNLIAYIDLCVTRDARSPTLERWSVQPLVLGVSLASLVAAVWVVGRHRPAPLVLRADEGRPGSE